MDDVTVRLSRDIWSDLKRLSRKDKRTIKATIERLVEAKVKQKKESE